MTQWPAFDSPPARVSVAQRLVSSDGPTHQLSAIGIGMDGYEDR